MFRRSEEERREAGQPPEPANEPQAAPAARAQQAASEVTVLGQGARLEGTLVSAGSLRIDGQVKGKIRAEGDVTLSGSSRVEADIEAQNVTVAGEFTGTIQAKSRAELASGGRVSGDVTSKALVVAEGAIFSGQSIMGDQAAGRAGTAAGEGARSRSSGAPAVSGTAPAGEPAPAEA